MDRVDSIDFTGIRSILAEIPEKQQLILGSSGYRILNSLGIQTPRLYSLQHESEIDNLSLDTLESDRLVIKAISGEILHKADSKAIKIVDRNQSVAHNVIREMRGRFAPETIQEFLIEEYIPHLAKMNAYLQFEKGIYLRMARKP
jgi:succinyl-CoA synthetase beta subunit